MGFEGGESQIKSKEVEKGICTDCVKEEKNDEEKGSRGYHNEVLKVQETKNIF